MFSTSFRSFLFHQFSPIFIGHKKSGEFWCWNNIHQKCHHASTPWPLHEFSHSNCFPTQKIIESSWDTKSRKLCWNKKINISQQIWEFFPPIIGHKKTGEFCCWKQKRSRQVLSADQLFQSGPKGGTGSPQAGAFAALATELLDRNSIFTLELTSGWNPKKIGGLSSGSMFFLFRKVGIFSGSMFVGFRGCSCCYDILFMEEIQPTTYLWCRISEPSKSTPLEIPVLKPQHETFLFKPDRFIQVPGVDFPGCMMLDWIMCISDDLITMKTTPAMVPWSYSWLLGREPEGKKWLRYLRSWESEGTMRE